MSPKKREAKRRLDLHLRSTAEETYGEILRILQQENPNAVWAPLAASFKETGDVHQLVLGAERLLAQKYASAELHFSAVQFCYLVRKYPFAPIPGINRKQVALDKWLGTEQRCKELNAKFRDLTWEGEEIPRARTFIRWVIGDSPELDRVSDRAGITPGASVGVHGNATNVARKLASSWSVSPRAHDYAYRTVASNAHLRLPLWESRKGISCYDNDELRSKFNARVTHVDYNKIDFVPKTVLTDRSIAVEPFLNGLVQKGTDDVLRDKLLRISIDLSDQSRNQFYAKFGSEDDSEEGFVTIDLSSASDSIATEMVRTLLPEDWFYFLNRIRSHNYRLPDGSQGSYEKFCSMGNGFCFPLQTLIFCAACHAVGCGRPKRDYIVYGDDIIVRRKHATRLINFLHELGFTENADKTFLEGPFRESCGADWFGGEDVRPFTLDFRLDSVESVFKFLNLSERSERCKHFFSPVRGFVKKLLSSEFDFQRPFPGSADTAYQVELDEFMSSPHARWHKNLQAWSWKELITRPVADKHWRGLRDADSALLFAALTGSPSTMPFTLRRKTKTAVRVVSHG